MGWITFEGKAVPFDEMDHQHISNIYWYHMIILDDGLTANKVFGIIKRRFKGEVLPYIPHPDFEMEKETLAKQGRLQSVYSSINGEVIYYHITDGDIPGSGDGYNGPDKNVIGYLFTHEQLAEYNIKREIGLR